MVRKSLLFVLALLWVFASTVSAGRPVAGVTAAADFDVALEGEARTVLGEGTPLYPTFAPDGKTLAVSLAKGADYDIYAVDVASGKADLLVGGEGNQLYPAFFPEGDRLAYCSDETGKLELYLYDVKSKTAKALTTKTPYQVRWPEVSPVFWSGASYDEPYRTVIYEADSGDFAEVFMAHEWGEPVQLTKNVYTPPSALPESEYGDSDYVDVDVFSALAPTSNYYPRWAAGGMGFMCLSRHAKTTDLLWLTWTWPFTVGEKAEIADARFAVPSANFTQYLLMDAAGAITLHDTFRAETYDVGNGDAASPPAISPDGKVVAYVRGGRLLIQRVANPLSEVANLYRFTEKVTPAQLETLAANGFLVSSGSYANVVDAYHRYHGPAETAGPFFITTDSVLYLLYLYYDYLLRTVETEALIPLVGELTAKALAASEKVAAAAPPETREDAEFVRDYWLVARGLMDPVFAGKAPPPPVEGKKGAGGQTLVVHATTAPAQKFPARVEAEWANIAAASGSSEMFPGAGVIPGLDYSMFTVRGHYGASEELGRYFQTVMWLSQTYFPMNDPKGDAASAARAVLLCSVTNAAAAELMDRYYDAVGLFVGEPEAVNYKQLNAITAKVAGADLAPAFAAVAKLEPPKIQPQRGFAFALLPQVFTPDAYFLQRLVYPAVGTDAEPRGLPKGLDLFAVLGDARAEELLRTTYDEGKYQNYADAFNNTKYEAGAYDAAFWETSISYRWLDLLRALPGPKDGRYPAFMRNVAWQDKSLMTALASWATLRHANVLYAKGTGAYGSGGGPPEEPVPPKPKGYVEPNAAFYGRLSALLEDTRARLTTHGMWCRPSTEGEYGPTGGEAWQAYELMLKMVTRLGAISEKELAGTPRSDADYQFIDDYGLLLWRLASFYQVATGDAVPREAEGDARLPDPLLWDRHYTVRRSDGARRYYDPFAAAVSAPFTPAVATERNPALGFQFIPVYPNDLPGVAFAYGGAPSLGVPFVPCAADAEAAPAEEYRGSFGGGNITDFEQALVADVATFYDPVAGKNYILHEALGRSHDIICVHDADGRPQISLGGCLSYYEFVEEGQRLTDDDWKGKLVGEKAADWAFVDYKFKDITDDAERNKLEEQYKAALAEAFAANQTPQMPAWTSSFLAPATFTVAVSALRLWNKAPARNEYAVEEEGLATIGTLREGDKVTWLGLEETGPSPKQPDDSFRWLLVETSDGKRGWVARWGLVGELVPTREVYLR